VYGAVVPETAVSEFLARARRLGLPLGPVLPAVLASFEVALERALDLTDRATLAALGLSPDDLATELALAWEASDGETLGQRLGAAAFEGGRDGLVVPSAAAPGRINVAVFPDRSAPIRARGIEPIPHGPG
jgi:RES domain-containing protein